MKSRKYYYAVSFTAVMAVLLLCLSSCSFFRARQLDELTSEEGAKIREESEEIIRCLTENDREGFCRLFCEEVRQEDTFDREVNDAFDFFQCEVYIKSEINELAGGGQTTEGGRRSKWYVTPEITYIKVLQDTGGDELADRYYGVSYYWVITDAEHPENEGIHYLQLDLLNMDRSVSVGSEE